MIGRALPDDLCARLLAARPGYPGDPSCGANLRLPIPGWMLRDMPFYDPLWAAFADRHLQADVPRRVARIFRAHWPDEYSHLL